MISSIMTTNSLAETVDSWTVQALVASGYLVQLYRKLHDDRQADLAMRALGRCEERAQRLGLQVRKAVLQAEFAAENLDETIGEQKAWELLIEAQAGICAFYGMVDDFEMGRGIRGPSTVTMKAFHKSLQGYRAAFPEEVTTPGIQRAVEIAASKCSEAFALEVDGITEEHKANLRQEIHSNVLDALMKETLFG